MVEKALETHDEVVVLVRDCKIDESNPLDARVIAKIIEHAFKDTLDKHGALRVTSWVMIDFDTFYYGRQVGYKVEEMKLDDTYKDVSASSIKEQIDPKFWEWINSLAAS